LSLGVGTLGPGDMAKSMQTYRHYDITHKNKQKSKTFKLKKNLNYISYIFKGFERISSSISWQVMLVQRGARKVAHMRFKSTMMLYTGSQHAKSKYSFRRHVFKQGL